MDIARISVSVNLENAKYRFWATSRVKETNKVMSGRPALIRQRDCKQIINAAKKAGAKQVEFRVGAVPVIVHLDESAEKPAANTNEWLTDDSHSA
jgi:hypothetical protein